MENLSKDDSLVSPLMILGRITTIPMTVAKKKQATYLVINNNSGSTLFLSGLYLQDSKKSNKLELVQNNEFIDSSLCDTIKVHDTCKLVIFPHDINNYLLIAAFKDAAGNKYINKQLISVAKPVISHNGFTYFADNLTVTMLENAKSSISVPFILDDDYTDILVNTTDKFAVASVLCSNRTNFNTYPKGSMCTALIEIPDGVYTTSKVNQLIIKGVRAINSQETNEVNISYTLAPNTVANIIASASNVIINPADGASGSAQHIFLYNSGVSGQASSINFYVPSPLTISYVGATNPCGTTLNAGVTCDFFVNVTTGLSTSGQTSITMSYSNGPTQLITFNIIYILSSSPGLTVLTNTNFTNTLVGGINKYVPVQITNTGSVAFTNLQFNSISNQNANMAYGSIGSTCAIGQSLAVGASCTTVIGYIPTGVESGSVTIIPVVTYTQNGNTLSYAASSTAIAYSAVNTNNYVIGGDYGAVSSTTDLTAWTSRMQVPFATNVIILNAISQGVGSVFILGESNGAVFSSTAGGMFWTAATSAGGTAITDIIYVSATGTYYVSGGSSPRTIRSSTNLAGAWTTRYTATAGIIVNRLFANAAATVYIAPETTILATSLNGTTWTQQTVITGNYFTTLLGSDVTPTYYAFGVAGVSASSTDPTTAGTWVANPVINANFTARDSVLNDGLYVTVGVATGGGTANIFTTTNPQSIAWTARNTSAIQLNSVVFGNSTYVAVGNTGTIFTSLDGAAWTSQTSGTTANLLSVHFDGTFFWATGTAIILSSIDGITWNRLTINSIAYNNTNFMAVGINGLIYTSPNLTTWTQQTSTTTETLNYITCIQTNLCVAVGNNGKILTGTTNGTVWSTQTSGTPNDLMGFACGFYECIAVGASGTILLSTDFNDFSSWTTQTPSPALGFDVNSVAYYISPAGAGNNLYVIVGSGGNIRTSPDGVTWATRTSGVATALNSVYCESRATFACIAVGANGVILTSPDGITWTSRTSGATNTLNAVSMNNGNYVVVGDANTLRTSTNGTTWTGRTSQFNGTTSVNIREVFTY